MRETVQHKTGWKDSSFRNSPFAL